MNTYLSILAFIIFIGIMFITTTSFANPKISDLSVKQQAIIPIASYTATGNIDKLKIALNNGLDSGLTINETKEIMVHLYAYCGFPRTLNGLGALNEVLQERQASGIVDTIGKEATPIEDNINILEMGTQIQTKLSGNPVNITLSPAIDKFLKTHLFGDLFLRDVLNYTDREIATISALASMEGTQSQLLAHFNVGHNAGLSYIQLQDIIKVLDVKVNSSVAQNAQKILDIYLQ